MNARSIQDLYRDRFLAFSRTIPRTQRLEAPHTTEQRVSRLCGSRVTVDVVLKDGAVQDFGQEVKACAIGRAAASILGHHVIGATPADLAEGAQALRAILKDGAAPPSEGRWTDLAVLQPVRDYPARHASCLLAFEAAAAAAERAATGAG